MDIDLDAYFARIAYSGSRAPSLETLRKLHLHHPLAIPFENLSTLAGEPVPLDLASLQRKLVAGRRGGYCFEHNRLFAAVLERLGFSVRDLAARVVWNRVAGRINPRTHMVLLIETEGARRYIADVGFGAVTLTAPVELVLDEEQQTPHESFRLVDAGGEYELQVRLGAQWRPMYQFDLQPQLPIDFEVLNHYVATHPSSHFLTTLMAGRPTARGRYTLANCELQSYGEGSARERRRLGSVAELEQVLTEVFDIELPDDTGLRAALEKVVAAGQ